jgi:hypothetical protein
MRIKNYQIKNKKIHKLIHAFSRAFFRFGDAIGEEWFSTRRENRPLKKFIDKKNGLVYLENPLVASQSISSLFTDKSDGSCFSKRMYVDDAKKKLSSEKYPFSFTAVRSPWSRIASLYNKKIRNATSVARIALISQFEGLKPGMSFENFIKVITSIEYKRADPHWAPQVVNVASKRYPKYIIRIEKLEKSLSTLFEMSGRDFHGLPHHGGSEDQIFSPIRKEDLFDKISDYMIERLNRYYYLDCISFGYPLLGKQEGE